MCTVCLPFSSSCFSLTLLTIFSPPLFDVFSPLLFPETPTFSDMWHMCFSLALFYLFLPSPFVSYWAMKRNISFLWASSYFLSSLPAETLTFYTPSYPVLSFCFPHCLLQNINACPLTLSSSSHPPPSPPFFILSPFTHTLPFYSPLPFLFIILLWFL